MPIDHSMSGSVRFRHKFNRRKECNHGYRKHPTIPTKDELQSELAPLPEPLEPPEPLNEPAYEEIVGIALRHARGRRGGDLVSVLLVGSGARRAVTTHSDVDLIVLVKGQADSHEIVRVADRMA